MGGRGVGTQLAEFFWSDPLYAVALSAAVIALATAPVALAVLARLDWFQARRGRVSRKPSFVAVITGTMLVMGIPALFCAIVVKSRYYDRSRYEFDPNQTLTVIDQGRMYNNRQEIETAIQAEMKRLGEERKKLVENVKKLDEAMITLRAASAQAPAVAQALPNVLEKLAGVRKSVGLDAPQQLEDATAPPVELAHTGGAPAPAPAANVAVAPAPAPAAPSPGSLTKAEVATELGNVPAPQKALAATLPLEDVPAGWTVGKAMGASGKQRLETFNADNLFEKIDGRAESFLQYDVKSMAYTFYHPIGDESGDVQLYVFEMGSTLKALGKYGSEKPEDSKPATLGSEGYSSAGSVFFYSGPYYVQIVSNKEDPRYASFSMELAQKVAARLQGGGTPGAPGASPAGPTEAKPKATPESIFALLPKEPKRGNPTYVAQDVFGYSFLADVFMADYSDGDKTWQGFLRPYATDKAAQEVFEKYVASAKQDGAKVTMIETDGADGMFKSENVGLIDVIFLKGNVVAGANGATDGPRAEEFARAFAKELPKNVPAIEETKAPAPAGEGAGEGDESKEN